MTVDDSDGRLAFEVSTTEALQVAPDSGGGGARAWWVVLAAVALAAAVVVAVRVGNSSTAPQATTTSTVAATVTPSTTVPASSAPASSLGADDIEVGDVVETDVLLPYLGRDVGVLDDEYRLWVLHPADGTATYRGQVELDRISPVGTATPPASPTLNVSDGGWLLVGGTFGTVTVNPEGQHILTAHEGADRVFWTGTDSRTYTFLPDLGAAHVEYDGGGGWLPVIRVGPMDSRSIVATDEGSFLIDGGEVNLLTPDQVLDANQRFFVQRSSTGQLSVAELDSGALVGTVSLNFVPESATAEILAYPDWEAILSADGRIVSLLNEYGVYVVDVASGAGDFVPLDIRRDRPGVATAAWDPSGEVVTWVVGGEVKILGTDRTRATIGPTIATDGPISIGTPIAAVVFEPESAE